MLSPAMWRFLQPISFLLFCAIVAIACTLAVIIWHVLATETAYTDLGSDFYATRADPAKETQRLIAKLEALGHTVTLAPAA